MPERHGGGHRPNGQGRHACPAPSMLDTPAVATARILLSGAGASGERDYTIIPALRPMARHFGAVRLWMGVPWADSFGATTRRPSR